MKRYRCPDNSRMQDDVVGCGKEFEAAPDEEGYLDCPHCGMYFKPTLEDARNIEPKEQL